MTNNPLINLFGHPNMQSIVKQREKAGVACRMKESAIVCLPEGAR